jgi:NAD-dependent DNA ligase
VRLNRCLRSPIQPMIKSLAKFFLSFGGKHTGSELIFHPTEKCSECGTRLMRSDRKGGLREFLTDVRSSETNGDSCNSSLREEGDNWSCPNLDCPAQIRRRIKHWCSPGAMGITDNITLLAKLVGLGLVRDVAELYRLKIGEIAALPDTDQDSAKEFFDAITASQKREAWRLLFGLSIPLVGEAEAKSLCQKFASVDNVFAASVERLRQAEGVNEAVARSIVQWHSDSVNRRLVKRLFKAGLNFKV